MGHIIAHLSQKLVAEQLRVMRGNRLVIRDISLVCGAGEAVILTGANGVGKTTLMRAIAGFLPLVSGRIRLEGGTGDSSVGERCHYVGHLNGVKRSLTVMETLQFFADFLGGSKARAKMATERLGLAGLADIPAGYLSAGQKRRLALARLLCAERPLWLLDEPTVSLDVASQGLLAEIVNTHLADGGIVLAATHIALGWSNMTAFDLERAAALNETEAL
jgi:heme exporter protein A